MSGKFYIILWLIKLTIESVQCIKLEQTFTFKTFIVLYQCKTLIPLSSFETNSPKAYKMLTKSTLHSNYCFYVSSIMMDDDVHISGLLHMTNNIDINSLRFHWIYRTLVSRPFTSFAAIYLSVSSMSTVNMRYLVLSTLVLLSVFVFVEAQVQMMWPQQLAQPEIKKKG